MFHMLAVEGMGACVYNDGRAEHKGRPYGFKKDETEWLKPAAVVTMNPITHSPNTRQKLRQLAAVFRNKKPRDKERAFKAHTNKSLYCLLCATTGMFLTLDCTIMYKVQ